MLIRRISAPRAFTTALAMTLAAWIQPATAQNRQINATSGVLLIDGSCPGFSYILASCPCDPPQILYHIDSTKVDLAPHAGHFVSLRGAVRGPGCSAPIFEVRKATEEPNRPCPCPASDLASGDGARSCPRSTR